MPRFRYILSSVSPLLLAAGCAASVPSPQPEAPAAPVPTASSTQATVIQFEAKESDVNAFAVIDDGEAVLIDCTRNPEDATAFVEAVRKSGATPTHLLITHGHPDHYLGMRTVVEAFPAIELVVANEDIKKDIVGFTAFMEKEGWLDHLPSMKRQTSFAEGFDYDQIKVLDATTLTVGDTSLVLDSDHPPAEAEHVTTVTIPAQKLAFVSDLAYRDVHLWMGAGVSATHIDNWKSELTSMESELAGFTIYPGHGPATDTSVFADNRSYMSALIETVESSDTVDAAMEKMQARYPGHRNADFLLKMSVTHQHGQSH